MVGLYINVGVCIETCNALVHRTVLIGGVIKLSPIVSFAKILAAKKNFEVVLQGPEYPHCSCFRE